MNLRHRDTSLKDRLHKIPLSPPAVYFKPIQTGRVRHSSSDIEQCRDISRLSHLFMHRNNAGAELVQFEGSLRSARINNKRLLERERKWRIIPKHDRKEEPSFIKQKSIKKIRDISFDDVDSAFDGYSNFPMYNEKLKEKDISKLRHLYGGEFKLPTLQWQISLREGYSSPTK